MAFSEGVAMLQAFGFRSGFGVLCDAAELAALAAFLAMIAMVARLLGA
jgi:hypothetical protein